MTTYSFARFSRALLICAGLWTGQISVGLADVPDLINFQGQLTDDLGNPIADGDYQLTLSIHDVPSEGSALWTSGEQTISVTGGLFEYKLGSHSPLPDSLFATGAERWLEIEVGGEQLAPRTKLTSVAYAYHSLRADTAFYALSGSGGWIDGGTTVSLASPSDSVGIGTPNPQGRLDVSGDAHFRREDRPGDRITMNVSSGPVGIQIRSGTTGGTPLIDFANDDTTDFDARMVLVEDSAMWFYGKPYIDLKLAGNLRVERTQSESMIFGKEVDGINSFYTYKGTAADPYSYQGAAIHATALVGGDATNPVGTVTGIASQAAMLESGDPFNELTPLFLSCNTLEPARLWGIDLSVHGPVTAQSNLIQGLVNFVNNYNPTTVTYGSFGLSVVTKPGRGGAATPEQRTAQTYPLDVGLAISGKSGDGVTQTEGYHVALQVGGSASGWMNPGERSILSTGIQVSDVTEVGARFENFHVSTAPALSIGVPYVMEITESNTAKWLLSREGTDADATLLLRDLTEVDEWWWGAFAGGDKRLSFQNDRMVVMRNGNVGFGTMSPTNILTVEQSSVTDPIADGWTTYSSRRWKTNIEPVEGAIDKVQRLRGVSFEWKSNGKRDIGLIAEEVGVVIPEVVGYEANGTDAKSVDYGRLVALLIEATKEQQEAIENLKAQLIELQEKVGRM